MVPCDPTGYLRKGLFCTQRYDDCAMYGRPLEYQLNVCVNNPLVDTSDNIVSVLFGSNSKQMKMEHYLGSASWRDFYEVRLKVDIDICEAARELGYDSVIDIDARQWRAITRGWLPRNADLNVLYPATCTNVADQIEVKPIYNEWTSALAESLELEIALIEKLHVEKLQKH